MEQKAKKFDELNRYERAMATATLENKLEAMANELNQMALALKISIHVDSTFHNWGEEPHTSANVSFISGDAIASREVKEDGSLFGIIEEALAKKTPQAD